MTDSHAVVVACGQAAAAGAPSLAAAPSAVIDKALRAMAGLLADAAPAVLAANADDVAAGQAAGLGGGLLDRLRLDEARITEMARQIGLLADAPFPPEETPHGELPNGLALTERRVPVGVVGANFEARPNVTVDVASQLLKSRNAGVLRTGAAALGSSAALFDHVIGPAMTAAGLDPGALQLVRSADRQAARRAGQPARPDPAGDPARQRRDHPGAGRARPPGTACAPSPTPTAAASSTSTGPPTPPWPSRSSPPASTASASATG